MEIFNTIGQLLTTPNEGVSNIICAPLVIVEAMVSMLLFTTILNIEASKKQKSLYIAVVSALGLFVRLVIPNPYRYFSDYDCYDFIT